MTDNRDSLEAEQRLIGQQRRDPATVQERLLPWLKSQYPQASHIELPLPVPPTGGGSSDSFFITPTVHIDGEAETLPMVLRIEPCSRRIYEQRSIERQYGVMKSLHDLRAAPVPKMLAFEPNKALFGEAFLVMERIAGDVPHDRYHAEGLLVDAAPAQRTAIWNNFIAAMAGLHRTDAKAFAFLDRPEFGANALEQELNIWESYAKWLALDLTAWQQQAGQWLRDNAPRNIIAGLSWGDARLPNTIFRGTECHALLDWETVSLAGGENDLGWMLFYDWFVTEAMGVERLAGVPKRDDSLQLWSQLVGREPRAMRWHEIAALWRFSLLRDRSLHLAGIDSAPFMASGDPLMVRYQHLMAQPAD
jgi:aminoglycoside phosphotransferase (APT) family kinase protein